MPYCGIAYEAAPTSAQRSSWLCDRAWSPRWRGCARRMRTCPCGSPAQARCGSVESASRPRMLRTGYFVVWLLYAAASAASLRAPVGLTRARFKDEADAEALIDNVGGWKVEHACTLLLILCSCPGLPRTAVVPISLSPQSVAGHTRVVPSFYQLRGLMSIHNPLGLNPEVTAILSFPMRHWAFRDCYACFVVQLAE